MTVATGYEHLFRPAIRSGVTLVVGIAGASGSGKTMSAMRMAQGIVGRDKAFAVIDTEARRALHYAPRPGEEPDFTTTFRFDHCELSAPFRPENYEQAIRAAAKGYGAVVVDSFSHVHEGEGGQLDWQNDILTDSVKRAMEREKQKPANRQRGEWEIRHALTRSSWIEPKRAHKVMVQALLQMRTNIILCLRAEDKIDFVKDEDGKTVVVPMKHAAGYSGWIPICDKRLPFELTVSFILTPDKPGVPKPIKLQEQHKAIFPADQLIGEESGKRLAEWARGGAASTPTKESRGPSADGALTAVSGRAESTAAPTSDTPSRETMLAAIVDMENALKLGSKERLALWAAHCGSATEFNVDVSALSDLAEALRKRAA